MKALLLAYLFFAATILSSIARADEPLKPFDLLVSIIKDRTKERGYFRVSGKYNTTKVTEISLRCAVRQPRDCVPRSVNLGSLLEFGLDHVGGLWIKSFRLTDAAFDELNHHQSSDYYLDEESYNYKFAGDVFFTFSLKSLGQSLMKSSSNRVRIPARRLHYKGMRVDESIEVELSLRFTQTPYEEYQVE